jgi:16S rRNA processing protein RimM
VPDAAYDAETLLIGVMGRPHGLRGETTLRTHNPNGSDLAQVGELILERPDGAREVRRVESIRRFADGWLVRLIGIASRDDADGLTNLRVRVPRRALPPAIEGEFFVEDTIGCDVFAEEGARLGTVEATFWNGAQNVWVVRGAREILIPVVPAFVRTVDAAQRRIVVAWVDEPEDETDDG